MDILFKREKDRDIANNESKLKKRFRMVFEVADEPIPRKSDGGLDWTRLDSSDCYPNT